MKYLFLLLFIPISSYAYFNEELYEFEKTQYFNKHQYDFVVHILDGNSMTHLGFDHGDLLTLYHNRLCQIDDVCSFTCKTDKCINGADDTFLKQVTRTRYVRGVGMYYTFEGRPGKYPCLNEPSKMCVSFDSTFYGELLYGRDFVFVGWVD